MLSKWWEMMNIHRAKTKFKTEWEGSYPVKRILSDPFSFLSGADYSCFYAFPTPTMEYKKPWNGYGKPSFHILNLSNIQI